MTQHCPHASGATANAFIIFIGFVGAADIDCANCLWRTQLILFNLTLPVTEQCSAFKASRQLCGCDPDTFSFFCDFNSYGHLGDCVKCPTRSPAADTCHREFPGNKQFEVQSCITPGTKRYGRRDPHCYEMLPYSNCFPIRETKNVMDMKCDLKCSSDPNAISTSTSTSTSTTLPMTTSTTSTDGNDDSECLACLTKCNNGSADVSYKNCSQTHKVIDCLLDTCAKGPCNINGNGQANAKQLCRVYKKAIQWATYNRFQKEAHECALEKCPESSSYDQIKCTECTKKCSKQHGDVEENLAACSDFNELIQCEANHCYDVCGVHAVQDKCVKEKARAIVLKSEKSDGENDLPQCDSGCNGASIFYYDDDSECLACLTKCNNGSADVSYKNCSQTHKVIDCLLDTCAKGPCNINGNGQANAKQLCRVYKKALHWTTRGIHRQEARDCALEKCPASSYDSSYDSEDCNECAKETCLVEDAETCSEVKRKLECQAEYCDDVCGDRTVQNNCVTEKAWAIQTQTFKAKGFKDQQQCDLGCNGATLFE